MNGTVIELSDSDESFTLPLNSREFQRSRNVSDFEFPPICFEYEGTTKSNSGLDAPDSALESTENYADTSDNSLNSVGKSQNVLKRKSNEDHKKISKPTERVAEKLKQNRHIEKLTRDRIIAEQREKVRSKKEEAASVKRAIKAAKDLEAAKRKDAENCLKAMTVVIDESLQSSEWYNAITDYLQQTEVTYVTKSHQISDSVSWKRISKNYHLNDNNVLQVDEETEDENQIVIIWDCRKAINMVADGTFNSSISELRSLMPNKTFTLVIFGANGYFKYIKHKQDESFRDEILGNQTKSRKPKGSKMYKDLPVVSRKQLETCLIEIQLMNCCNSRLVETMQELALMIFQYTKALAKRPITLLKTQDLAKKVDWYAKGDNRDTVKVDKNGYGLKRLWQQQLSEFTLSSLETAEAIASIYKSPLQLLEAYQNCTQLQGEMLLRDIPIRRAAGPLATTRKIGPELSKKIFIMFTSKEGKDFLSGE